MIGRIFDFVWCRGVTATCEGLIPEALGELRELWKLDLLNNNLRGE